MFTNGGFSDEFEYSFIFSKHYIQARVDLDLDFSGACWEYTATFHEHTH